jgi:hypothetical protein
LKYKTTVDVFERRRFDRQRVVSRSIGFYFSSLVGPEAPSGAAGGRSDWIFNVVIKSDRMGSRWSRDLDAPATLVSPEVCSLRGDGFHLDPAAAMVMATGLIKTASCEAV